MPNQSIFADAWRDCLREHYKHTIQNDPNQRNLDTLKAVLLRPNGDQPPIFTETELRQLYVEATMRADQMPDGFVPDEILQDMSVEELMEPQVVTIPDDRSYQPHPLECQCPQCVTINLVPHSDEGQPLSEDEVAELEEQQSYDRRKKGDDVPQQLSLF
jgi:hypothetical protein